MHTQSYVPKVCLVGKFGYWFQKWEAVIHWNMKLYDMFIIYGILCSQVIDIQKQVAFAPFAFRQTFKSLPTIDKRYCDWKLKKKTICTKKQVLYIYTHIGGQTTSKTYATNFTYYAHWPPTKRTNYNEIKQSKRWTHEITQKKFCLPTKKGGKTTEQQATIQCPIGSCYLVLKWPLRHVDLFHLIFSY